MFRSKDLRKRVKEIGEYLLEEYKQSKKENKRDWRTYEQDYSRRIKEAIKQLSPLIDEAVSSIKISSSVGSPNKLTLKQRVQLILLKELFSESNRMMAAMLDIFSILSGIDVSYKSVERLYSDEEVVIALNNLHSLILRKKGINNPDTTGDGTGYSLTIKKHYSADAQRLKDKAKETKIDTKSAFVYSFKLMDIKTKMYIAYGTSMKSEKQAFCSAIKMLDDVDVNLSSIRLDKYYSYPSCVDMFDTEKVFIIPKKNATLKGSWKWKRLMKHFTDNTLQYMEEYYKRENSESGWSADKKRFGWKIEQRRPDRIDTADFCITIWHNLFRIGGV
ncbi:MAG: ISNCY family transposase [Patescibacteria group bacterium]